MTTLAAARSQTRCAELEVAIATAAGKLLVTEAEYRYVLALLLHRSVGNALRAERYPDPEAEQQRE